MPMIRAASASFSSSDHFSSTSVGLEPELHRVDWDDTLRSELSPLALARAASEKREFAGLVGESIGTTC